jgi:hypothetical protein
MRKVHELSDILIKREDGYLDFATAEEIKAGKNLVGLFCTGCSIRLSLDDVFDHKHRCEYVDKSGDKPIIKSREIMEKIK